VTDALPRLLRAKDVMDARYAETLDVATLAAVATMSPGYFSRAFRDTFGETPHRYLMTRRIERAMALLRAGGRTVTDVCHAVGFCSLGSFTVRFGELTGECPSAYAARWADPVARDTAARVPACMAKAALRPLR
jgi:AraC-like DNA-binding protein